MISRDMLYLGARRQAMLYSDDRHLSQTLSGKPSANPTSVQCCTQPSLVNIDKFKKFKGFKGFKGFNSPHPPQIRLRLSLAQLRGFPLNTPQTNRQR